MEGIIYLNRDFVGRRNLFHIHTDFVETVGFRRPSNRFVFVFEFGVELG
jgi:hypothetical protein